MIRNRISIGVATVMSLCVATPASTQQPEPGAGGELFEKLQSEFAEAYNRKDIAGMAAFFSENGSVSHLPVFSVVGMPSTASCGEW